MKNKFQFIRFINKSKCIWCNIKKRISDYLPSMFPKNCKKCQDKQEIVDKHYILIAEDKEGNKIAFNCDTLK